MGIGIYLNGKVEEVKNNLSVSELLKSKNIRPEVVTVELNEQIVDRSRYNDTYIKDNDVIEFVYYMGGGEEEDAF